MLNLNNTLTNFQTFNDKMIISSSKDDKKILLWDENTLSVIYTYEDPNMKSFISKEKLLTVSKDLYSEYILCLQENKSLISIWKTNSSECAIKCSPIEERITSLDISNNSQVLIICTETGTVYLYEIFSGNLINSTSVSTTSILSCKFMTQDGGVILILSEDYIRLFSIENLIVKNNLKALKEMPNYDGFNNFLYMAELNICIFLSTDKNKICLYSFPQMTIIKSLYFNNKDVYIVNVTYDISNIFVTFEKGNFFRFNIKEILDNLDTVISFNLGENIFPVISVDTGISCVLITNKNIHLGCEDGKIKIYNKTSFKLENTFYNHKGGITNISIINRPISQFGLNFNSNVEEVIFKPLKKASLAYNNSVHIKNSIKREDYIENFIESLHSEEFSLKALQEDAIPTRPQNKKESEPILNDSNFLKKKLTELYVILKDQN